jgi:hypothetical protein
MTVRGVKGRLVQAAGAFAGLPGASITNVLLEDVDLDAPASSWTCSNVTGSSHNVRPAPCAALNQ